MRQYNNSYSIINILDCLSRDFHWNKGYKQYNNFIFSDFNNFTSIVNFSFKFKLFMILA